MNVVCETCQGDWLDTGVCPECGKPGASLEATMAEQSVSEQQGEALAQQKAHVNNLLARIFRDGGQRQAEFATTAEAVEAADKLCADYIAALAQREAEVARLTDELDKAQSDAENAVWNLAGCSIYALGYNLDEGHNMGMARPALNEVRELALKHRAAEASEARLRGHLLAVCGRLCRHCHEGIPLDDTGKWHVKDERGVTCAASRERAALATTASGAAPAEGEEAK